MCGVYEWLGSRTRCFIVMLQARFKYWRLPIIVGVHNIGLEGSNTVHHPSFYRYTARAG